MNRRSEYSVKIDKYLPLYYAGASGDFNLIHIDAEFAKRVGFERNILQGLCTLGIAAGYLIGDGDPGSLESIKVRFAHPVKPLDTLLFTSEEEKGAVTFRAKNQKGKAVLVDGLATLR